jgi:hypothetical protein
MQQVFRAHFKGYGLCYPGLVLKEDAQEGQYHGKGEDGKESRQYIKNNILQHQPFIGYYIF